MLESLRDNQKLTLCNFTVFYMVFLDILIVNVLLHIMPESMIDTYKITF